MDRRGEQNETKFEWTAPGFGAFIRRLRGAYPDKLILQNRGLFFFNPRNEPVQVHPARRPRLRRSSRATGSTPTRPTTPDPYFYPDNRFNFAPKLMAEANRPDGFRVLSLGYAEGPPSRCRTPR